jgi:dipeptidyl aminopeptidase/acylaminoacyl peptidase
MIHSADRKDPDPLSADVTAQWLAAPAPLHVDASPDGSRLAVTTAHVPLGAEGQVLSLVIVDVATGEVSALACAEPGDHTATWSPDGSRLAFTTMRTGTPQVAVCDADATEPTWSSSLPAGVTGAAAWAPDGNQLIAAGPRGRQIDRSRPWRITRAVAWADGIGPLDDPPQLWLCDITNDTCRMLTDDEWHWSSPRWSPDGSTVAAGAALDPAGDRLGQHLRLVRTDGSWTAPAVPGGFAVVTGWASDGSLLTLSIQPDDRPAGSEAALHRITPDGEVERIDRDAPAALGGAVYGDSPAAVGEVFDSAMLVRGMDVLIRSQEGGRMGVVRCSLTDMAWTVLVDGDRCATPLGVGAQGVVITDQSAGQPCRLRVLPHDDTTGPGRWLPLAASTDLPDCAEVRRFSTPSPHDGEMLEAWHLRPAGSDGPLPTILLIHGGPNAAFGECFMLDAQALCAAGFGVVYTNPHGSTGYGDAFTHAAMRRWGDIPSDDVLAVLDAAIALGWVDPDRLGVAGNSYGGYLSAWLVCTTDRFGAAVVENPAIDLLSMYGTSDIGAEFLPMHLGTTPLEDVTPYLQWSPLLRAAGCHTPVLFVVGADDRRCPPTQAMELHRTLHRLGRTSEVLVLPDSSHEGSTYGPPMVRLAHDAALVEWMDRWLRAVG